MVERDLSEAIRIRINNLMKENDLNESKLSTLAGISRSTISRFLKKERKYLRIDVIEYICEGLNIKLKDFFDDPIFDNINITE
ncbi:MAG: helix-turn-helix transcriptional regulator [Clostridiales bacterium]|nr:helix-turn-helix transcriptional regulator [Clostridiales bacterium]